MGRVKMQNGNHESYSECGLRNLWPRWDGYSRVALRGASRRMQFMRAASHVVMQVDSLEISQPKSDDGTDKDVASATSTSTSTSTSAM